MNPVNPEVEKQKIRERVKELSRIEHAQDIKEFEEEKIVLAVKVKQNLIALQEQIKRKYHIQPIEPIDLNDVRYSYGSNNRDNIRNAFEHVAYPFFPYLNVDKHKDKPPRYYIRIVLPTQQEAKRDYISLYIETPEYAKKILSESVENVDINKTEEELEKEWKKIEDLGGFAPNIKSDEISYSDIDINTSISDLQKKSDALYLEMKDEKDEVKFSNLLAKANFIDEVIEEKTQIETANLSVLRDKLCQTISQQIKAVEDEYDKTNMFSVQRIPLRDKHNLLLKDLKDAEYQKDIQPLLIKYQIK